jgi:sugar lactone lactonase YvrE
LRIDRQNRLWVLDYGNHGFGDVTLYAFDLQSDRLVHEFEFPGDIAGLGSMFNDFQVDAQGKKIYIADTSVFAQDQAIVVYDIEEKEARRLLRNHPSVRNGSYAVHIGGTPLKILGVFKIKFGVDSIALSRDGRWLYYAALNGGVLYRIEVSALNNEELTEDELGDRVESFADITLSDGITTDDSGNIYITDMENSAIHRVDPRGNLQTLLKDSERLRWPDGFSFGPDGDLYVTESALHVVMMKSKKQIEGGRLYRIYRFKPGSRAAPGH